MVPYAVIRVVMEQSRFDRLLMNRNIGTLLHCDKYVDVAGIALEYWAISVAFEKHAASYDISRMGDCFIYSNGSSSGTQLLLSLNDEQRCRYFSALLYVHIWGKGSTRQLSQYARLMMRRNVGTFLHCYLYICVVGLALDNWAMLVVLQRNVTWK